jgi:uncharacterized protein YndB with AHSA1/START domain
MAVTDVRKDLEALTMFVDSEFDAPPERIWQLWEDPRQLERWWGPPTYPATFDKHTGLVPGAFIAYHMTGPEGDHRLVIRDGFADESGDKNPELPDGLMRVSIDDIGGGRTRMTIANIFPSLEAMEQLLAMGQEEGMKQAVNQIDGILAENKAGALA